MDRMDLIAALRQFIKYTKELNTNLVLDETLTKTLAYDLGRDSCLSEFLRASGASRECALSMLRILTNDDR